MRTGQDVNDNRHEPREAFIDRLEHLVRAELRRAGVSSPARLPMSRGMLALAAALIAIVSATIGGGAVVVAYQARQSDLRERLIAVYEQRAALEQQRLARAREAFQAIENRAAVGIETPEAVLDARARVGEAEAALRLVELQVAEVKLTSQEPVTAASAPLVSGRDFVSERWRIELTVPQSALELERRRLQAARVRFNVGLAKANDVEAAGLRLIEVEAAIGALERKLSVRETFLKGLASAALTDLRVLEAEAEQRRSTLERRIDLVRRQVEDMEIRARIGTLTPTEVAGARLRLQELELALTKAVYDLDLIQDQIRRQKR